jgi:hypothetical protein
VTIPVVRAAPGEETVAEATAARKSAAADVRKLGSRFAKINFFGATGS